MPQAGCRPQSASRARVKEKLTLVEQTPRFSIGGDRSMDRMQVLPESRPMTRSQSRIREKYVAFSQDPNCTGLKAMSRAPFAVQLEKSMKSSHASVSLLTPRVKHSQENQHESVKSLGGLRRNSLAPEKEYLMDIDQVKGSPMDVDLVTPKVSHVLGVYNHNWSEATARRIEAVKPPDTRSRTTWATGLKPSSVPEPMSILKSGLKAVGNRARQVNEDMEKGGGDEGSGSRIMVYVRLRPMSRKEKEAGARSCVKIDNKRDVYLTEMALETDYLRLKRLRGRHFAFDAAFPDNTSQQDVYKTSTADLVEGVLDGKNASVFCYGATGAGKTFTMLGSVQQPGVMVLALKDLFTKLKQRSPEGEHVVRLSYLEVYNESVRDLLSPGRPLVLREDSRQGIVAAGLTQYQAYSADEVMTLLHKGNLNRQTEPTRQNETSSRSHAILQVIVEYKVQPQFEGRFLRIGKLSLIDLAGSERALATDQRTLRSVEGANINRSLLALSSCINALVEGKKHIPFRNSKLTQLLKDSLGGACQTAMIANVSPSNGSFGETQNTLHWADRAKEIKTKGSEVQDTLQVPADQDEKTKLLLQMQKENQELRLQLSRLEQKFLQNSVATIASSTPYTPASTIMPSVLAVGRNHLETLAPANETLARRVEAKTVAEKKIWELQRTVELLEMEAEKTRRDGALREEKMNASILQLTREHTLQLKHKDDFIRNLCNSMNMVGSPLAQKVAESPIKCLEKILSQRATSAKEKVADKAEKCSATAEKPRRYVTPKVASKVCPLPPSCARSALAKDPKISATAAFRRSTRTSQQPPRSPSSNLPKTPPLPRFFSPSKVEEQFGSCRKRTFWDITNSPTSLGRSPPTRTNNGGNSMLRQPGFARRRTSPEQE